MGGGGGGILIRVFLKGNYAGVRYESPLMRGRLESPQSYIKSQVISTGGCENTRVRLRADDGKKPPGTTFTNSHSDGRIFQKSIYSICSIIQFLWQISSELRRKHTSSHLSHELRRRGSKTKKKQAATRRKL